MQRGPTVWSYWPAGLPAALRGCLYTTAAGQSLKHQAQAPGTQSSQRLTGVYRVATLSPHMMEDRAVLPVLQILSALDIPLHDFPTGPQQTPEADFQKLPRTWSREVCNGLLGRHADQTRNELASAETLRGEKKWQLAIREFCNASCKPRCLLRTLTIPERAGCCTEAPTNCQSSFTEADGISLAPGRPCHHQAGRGCRCPQQQRTICSQQGEIQRGLALPRQTTCVVLCAEPLPAQCPELTTSICCAGG